VTTGESNPEVDRQHKNTNFSILINTGNQPTRPIQIHTDTMPLSSLLPKIQTEILFQSILVNSSINDIS
jgi:hypothetical protein